MSVLDTNFDSPREMPSRAAWLDNASAHLLNDNSYFNAAARTSEPAWLGKVDLFDSSRQPAAYEDAPTGDPVPVPKEPTPVGPEAPHPPEGKPAEEIELAPAEAAPPVGPRVAEGPPPPGTAPAGIPGNGPPEHTGPSLPYTSRSEKLEWEAKQRAELIAQQQAAAAAAAANDPGPGPDGRNADGTYGAGHHPYTPPTYYPDNAGSGMTEHNRPALAVEETPAPVYTPRPAPSAAAQALAAAVRRLKESGQIIGQTGTEGEGPKVAQADPNYQPGAPGSIGGLRGRRGG